MCVAAYLAWVAWMPSGTAHLSTGEISAAHAAFDQTCSQCHSDFVPIAVDAWRPQPADAIGKTAAKCRHCHATVHPHSQLFNAVGKQSDQHCAVCHSEHQGRSHQLIPTANDTCVACHCDVGQFCAASSLDGQQSLTSVTEFSLQGHGEFRALLSDDTTRSRIAFDHALHMQPGQVLPGRRGGMQLKRIAAEYRGAYQRPGDADDALVQLQCADCHQFQAGSAGRARSGEFDWGRGSLPVRYDQHCIACHPLTVPGQREGQLGIAHGRPLFALQDTLRGQLAALSSGSKPTLLPADELPIRIPGERAGGRGARVADRAAASEVAATDDPWPALQLQRTLEHVRRQCQLCHTDADLGSLVTLPRIPQPRLRAGRFDHGAHRTMSCQACHPGADPEGQGVAADVQPALALWHQRVDGQQTLPTQTASSLEHDGPLQRLIDNGSPDPWQANEMIRGIAACTECHYSTTASRGASEVASVADEIAIVFGGLAPHASARCTTCHRYHGESAGAGISSPPDAGPALRPSAAARSTTPSTSHFRQTHHWVSTAVAAASSATAGTSAMSTGSRVAEQRRASSAFDETPGQWLGSASCTTSTCHGGPIRDQADWNSSKSIFEVDDPHAQAAVVLAAPQSRQMVTLLDPAAAQSPERFQQIMRTRCHGCHMPGQAEGVTRQRLLEATLTMTPASGQSELATTSLQLSALLEGVSCEACHGPASGWLQAHLSADWQISNGMRENRNYVARLEGCVRCHVGSRRDDGVIRDVNHDLIAAGHPALRFEPWSALRRLPRHGNWQRSADGLPEIDGEAHLRRFLVGRAVSLRAAVRLTAERLEDAAANQPGAVWPELAEYDCFACHHSLEITNLATRPSPGFPVSHPWLISGFVADGLQQIAAEDGEDLIAELAKFRLRSAGGTEIVPAVRRIESILDRYLERLSDPRALPDSVAAWRRFDELHPADPSSDPPSNQTAESGWYAAAYWYLRFHVSLRDRQWPRDSGRAQDQQTLATALQQLADALSFGSREGADQVRVESPEQFELSIFRRLSERLADMVESN